MTRDSTLKGVMCIDGSYDELLATLNLYKQGQTSYPFLFDITTKIIQHPKVPVPNVITYHPTFAYLSTIETGPNIEVMLSSIYR